MSNITVPLGLLGIIGGGLFLVLYIIQDARDIANENIRIANERDERHYAHIRTHQHFTSPDQPYSSRAVPETISSNNEGRIWPNYVSGIRGWY